MKILLVEDHHPLREVLSRVLRKFLPISTVGVASAEEALHHLDDEVGLVVTDIAMPGMSGVDLIRALREAGSTQALPVLAMSADAANRESALEAGADGFLLKPFQNEFLLSAATRLLGLSTEG